MITRTDVEQTLLALEPATSKQEIELLWQTVSQEMDNRNQSFYATMKQKYQQAHGRIPDSLSDEKIRDRAYMDAENSVRGQYLEPLNAQIAQQEMEFDEQEEELRLEMLLEDPNSWKGEDEAYLPMPQWALDVANEMWGDEKPRVWVTAARRIHLMDHLNLPYPSGPGPLMDQWTVEIHQHIEQRARELAQALAPR